MLPPCVSATHQWENFDKNNFLMKCLNSLLKINLSQPINQDLKLVTPA